MKKTFSPRTTTWAMLFVVAAAWPSTGFSQDSLQNYSLARWKVDRLIKIALKAKECDSLVNDQQHLINADMRLQAKADSVISAQASDIRLYHEDISKRDSLDVVNQKIIDTQKKEIRKWKKVSIGAILLGVLIAML